MLFLLHTAGLFEFGLDRFWPLILIFLGVWLFAKQWGLIGGTRVGCQCEHCRTRKLMGPAMLVTLGVLFLLDSVSRVGFGRTWPAILLVIGVVKLMQSNASYDGHIGPSASGIVRLSAQHSADRSAVQRQTTSAESGATAFFWRGEKCLTQS